MPSSGPRPPAIIIHGSDNGLAVARSLGRRGIDVYALGCSHRVADSRFVRAISLPHPNPLPKNRRQALWLEWLLGDGAAMLPGAVLLPCGDDALELIAHHAEDLRRHYVVGEADGELILSMLDKARTYELANAAGVPTPRTWTVHTRQELQSVMHEFPYPCALKPRYSHLFRQHFNSKLVVVNCEDELLKRFEEVSAFGLQMLVTELIPGDDDQHVSCWTYIDREGQPLFQFTKQKVRQSPNHFGMGTFHMSVRNAEVAELGLRFARGAGLRGVGIIEFKRDANDGQFKLIECNARFPNPTEILVRSGIDFPFLVYQALVGGPLPPCETYREHVRMWFPLQDYRAFRSYQKSGDLSWLAWIGSLCHVMHVSTFHLSDPWPAATAIWDEVRVYLKRGLAHVSAFLRPVSLSSPGCVPDRPIDGQLSNSSSR